MLFNIIRLHLGIERPPADAQDFRRLGAVARGSRKGVADGPPFGCFNRLLQGDRTLLVPVGGGIPPGH